MTSLSTPIPPALPAQPRTWRLPGGLGAWLAGLVILAFLALFLLAPVGS